MSKGYDGVLLLGANMAMIINAILSRDLKYAAVARTTLRIPSRNGHGAGASRTDGSSH